MLGMAGPVPVPALRRQGSPALRYLRSVLFTQPISFHTVPLPPDEPYSFCKNLFIHTLTQSVAPRSHRMSLKITQFRTLSPRWSTLARMKKGIGLRAGMLSAFFPSPVSEESRCALGQVQEFGLSDGRNRTDWPKDGSRHL